MKKTTKPICSFCCRKKNYVLVAEKTGKTICIDCLKAVNKIVEADIRPQPHERID